MTAYFKHIAGAGPYNVDNKVLLKLDIHGSHKVLDYYYKINSIVLVILHYYHKLQPSDVGFINLPGIPVTLYYTAVITGKSSVTAFTLSKVIKWIRLNYFRNQSLYSFVTNRTEPDIENSTNNPDFSEKDTAKSDCSREHAEHILPLHLIPKKDIVTP